MKVTVIVGLVFAALTTQAFADDLGCTVNLWRGSDGFYNVMDSNKVLNYLPATADAKNLLDAKVRIDGGKLCMAGTIITINGKEIRLVSSAAVDSGTKRFLMAETQMSPVKSDLQDPNK